MKKILIILVALLFAGCEETPVGVTADTSSSSVMASNDSIPQVPDTIINGLDTIIVPVPELSSSTENPISSAVIVPASSSSAVPMTAPPVLAESDTIDLTVPLHAKTTYNSAGEILLVQDLTGEGLNYTVRIKKLAYQPPYVNFWGSLPNLYGVEQIVISGLEYQLTAADAFGMYTQYSATHYVKNLAGNNQYVKAYVKVYGESIGTGRIIIGSEYCAVGTLWPCDAFGKPMAYHFQ
jgi:hypothetical protein